MDWVIYTLRCPRTLEVRYVGWTSQGIRKRLAGHIAESVGAPNTSHRCKWVLSLLSIGLKPLIEAIESGSGKTWGAAERRWVSFYRNAGARLVNGTDGGDGNPGWGTPEMRSERARKANQNRTPETFKYMADCATIGRAKIPPAERSVIAKKRDANMTVEQRVARARHAMMGLTPEQRSAMAKRAGDSAWAKKTPEQRKQHSERMIAMNISGADVRS